MKTFLKLALACAAFFVTLSAQAASINMKHADGRMQQVEVKEAPVPPSNVPPECTVGSLRANPTAPSGIDFCQGSDSGTFTGWWQQNTMSCPGGNISAEGSFGSMTFSSQYGGVVTCATPAQVGSELSRANDDLATATYWVETARFRLAPVTQAVGKIFPPDNAKGNVGTGAAQK